jgi:hypothetical protein
MKKKVIKTLLILQLGLIVGISEYSCSCLPVFARLNGKYQLIRTFTSTETISQTSLSKIIEFVLKWDGRVNLTIENMYINDSLAASKEWFHTEDFCQKDRLKVTYADGTKREFSNVIGDGFVVTDYFTEMLSDTARQFEYRKVN